MTIREQYKRLLSALGRVSAEPDAEAKEILAHAYGLPFGRLIMRFFDEAGFADEVEAIASERCTGRPLAYVLRSRDFYGLNYFVDERVLIPRWDTEAVVEEAVRETRARDVRLAADLCCGSGCIGISLLKNTNIPRVYFCDISEGALEVARQNAHKHGVLDRAVFAEGDFLCALPPRLDLIVCNPPYISEEDYPALEAQVRDYEPRLALAAPEGGLHFYRLLAEGAASHLNPEGVLLAETGDGQAERAAQLLRDSGYMDVRIGADTSGMPRFVRGRILQDAG